MVQHVVPALQPKPSIRIIETRLLDRVETSQLMNAWSEQHQVMGLFPTCPLPKNPQLVLHRVVDGQEQRMHLRPFEIGVSNDDGSVKIVGWCYAPSWDHLRRYAQDVHGIELPETQTDA